MRVFYILTALLLLALQDIRAAEKDPNAEARRAVDPLGTSALADLERTQNTNNRLAVEHFTKLLRQNPKDALSHARRGKAYSGLKRYKEAMADYDSAIAIDSKLAEAYVGRAVVHYVRKDYDASWEDVRKAQSLGGEFWPSFMDALKESSGRNQ